MLNTEADPRVYFAAERTLLAWICTGITIMAFGFVVAKFGLVLRVLRAGEDAPVPTASVSHFLGAALVVMGIVAISAGSKRYREFCRRLGRSYMPSPHAEILPLILGWSLVALGAALVVVLLT